MSDNKPTVTFGESAVETIIEEFGWEIDEEGYISEEGERKKSFHVEEEVHKSDFGGTFEGDNGERKLLKKNFVEMVEYVKRKR